MAERPHMQAQTSLPYDPALPGLPLRVYPPSRQGIWHRAVYCYLFDGKGRLLIQRRSHDKKVVESAASRRKPIRRTSGPHCFATVLQSTWCNVTPLELSAGGSRTVGPELRRAPIARRDVR
jgi:hypothetical protein